MRGVMRLEGQYLNWLEAIGILGGVGALPRAMFVDVRLAGEVLYRARLRGDDAGQLGLHVEGLESVVRSK